MVRLCINLEWASADAVVSGALIHVFVQDGQIKMYSFFLILLKCLTKLLLHRFIVGKPVVFAFCIIAGDGK